MRPFAQPAEIDCTIGATSAQLVYRFAARRALHNWRNHLGRGLAARGLAAATALSFGLLSSGCPAPEQKPQVPAGPVDEWASLPKSPEWLHASAGFSGGH